MQQIPERSPPSIKTSKTTSIYAKLSVTTIFSVEITFYSIIRSKVVKQSNIDERLDDDNDDYYLQDRPPLLLRLDGLALPTGGSPGSVSSATLKHYRTHPDSLFVLLFVLFYQDAILSPWGKVADHISQQYHLIFLLFYQNHELAVSYFD